MEINIIYNAWVNKNRNWRIIIESQLNDMVLSGILEKSILHIVLIGELDDLINKAQVFIEFILKNNHISNYFIDKYFNNYFEYYGIKKLYDLANEEQDKEKIKNKIFLYFHTKGMFNHNGNPNDRSIQERILTRTIVNP